MSPLDDLLPPTTGVADDGIELFTELITAVAWLRRGAMPGLTVWDAIEEALRWRAGREPDWNEADLLGSALLRTLNESPDLLAAAVLAKALRDWLNARATIFNEGHPWRT